jgi:peptide/nickel transport system ATP-binding protein
MYAGRKVEEAPVKALFRTPRHPYTIGLMQSIPRGKRGKVNQSEARVRLQEIPGIVPSLREKIPGCAFAPRCRFATPRCSAEAPPLVEKGGGHVVACWETDRAAAAAA